MVVLGFILFLSSMVFEVIINLCVYACHLPQHSTPERQEKAKSVSWVPPYHLWFGYLWGKLPSRPLFGPLS